MKVDGFAYRAIGGIALIASLHYTNSFNGPAGSVPGNPWIINKGGFNHQIGALQCYVNDGRHLFENGHGLLVIRATKGKTPCGSGYTYESAGMKTSNTFFKYGEIASKIKIPCEQYGPWPAFWSDGANWPNGGEIDYLEVMKFQPNHVAQHIHGGPAHWQLGGFNNPIACGSWHIYGAKWSADKVQFMVDNKIEKTYTPANLKAGQVWPFTHSEGLRFDLQIGGSGGPPTAKVYSMYVAWVEIGGLNAG